MVRKPGQAHAIRRTSPVSGTPSRCVLERVCRHCSRTPDAAAPTQRGMARVARWLPELGVEVRVPDALAYCSPCSLM